MKNELVLFTDGEVNIEVQISPEQETVWLTQKQMGILFEVKHATISEHISNILSSGELDETSVGFSDKSTGGEQCFETVHYSRVRNQRKAISCSTENN